MGQIGKGARSTDSLLLVQVLCVAKRHPEHRAHLSSASDNNRPNQSEMLKPAVCTQPALPNQRSSAAMGAQMRHIMLYVRVCVHVCVCVCVCARVCACERALVCNTDGGLRSTRVSMLTPFTCCS